MVDRGLQLAGSRFGLLSACAPARAGSRAGGFVFAALAALVILAAPAIGADLTGQARAIDGDSLQIGETQIRLYAIDALDIDRRCGERPWPCGERAKAALEDLIAGRTVRCEPKGRTRRGAVVAQCIAGNRDLGEAMVWMGWARSASTQSPYFGIESEARLAGRGVWANPGDPPRSWRERTGGKVYGKGAQPAR